MITRDGRRYDEDRDPRVLEFLQAIQELSLKYGLCLGHEDTQGGFEVHRIDNDYLDWLGHAADVTDEKPPEPRERVHHL